jgi:hypothetical protein
MVRGDTLASTCSRDGATVPHSAVSNHSLPSLPRTKVWVSSSAWKRNTLPSTCWRGGGAVPHGPVSSHKLPSLPRTYTLSGLSAWQAATLPSTWVRGGGAVPHGPVSSHRLRSLPRTKTVSPSRAWNEKVCAEMILFPSLNRALHRAGSSGRRPGAVLRRAGSPVPCLACVPSPALVLVNHHYPHTSQFEPHPTPFRLSSTLSPSDCQGFCRRVLIDLQVLSRNFAGNLYIGN